MSKRPLTGPEKASATKRVRYEDEMLRREAKSARVAPPKAWTAALRVPCPYPGCEAGPRKKCRSGSGERQRSGAPHASRVLAGKGSGA